MTIDQATTDYDATIAEAMRRYLPAWDWRWLKAQLFQESLLNPDAVSGAGAQGIAQFMPATWSDMLTNVPDMPKTATPFDARWAIPAAAWYMAKLRSIWRTDRPEDDRRRLAQASYNAGGAREYALIVARLPDVTGPANAAQTRTYVARIQHWYDQLTDGGDHASR